MAAVVTLIERLKFTNANAALVDIAFNDNYPANGEVVALPLIDPKEVFFEQKSGYIFEYDNDNKKIKVYTAVGAVLDHTHTAGAITGATGTGASHTHVATTAQLILPQVGMDIKGAKNTDGENADQESLPTNGAFVVAETAVAEGAWTPAAYTNTDIGRNLCIVVHNDSGSALDLYEGAMKFTITGTWKGAAQTENITITSTTENKSVANGKYRFKYGVKPFDTITGAVVDNICADGLKIAVGLGAKIGLMNNLPTPAAADVVRITKNTALVDPATIVDTTNMTVNLADLTDNDDFVIWYKAAPLVASIATEAAHTHAEGTLVGANTGAGGAIEAAVATEVAEGTNLSSLSVRALVIGR